MGRVDHAAIPLLPLALWRLCPAGKESYEKHCHRISVCTTCLPHHIVRADSAILINSSGPFSCGSIPVLL